MKIIKGIVIFIFMINVFISPLNLYYLYRYSKVVLYFNDYDLIRVKIDQTKRSKNWNQSHMYNWNVFYFTPNNNKERIIIYRDDLYYKHFMSLGKIDDVFGGHLMPDKNDSIWVWHNPKAKDFYALGEKDTFKTDRYLKKIIFHFVLILIAIWSIRYQIRFNKKQKKRGEASDLLND